MSDNSYSGMDLVWHWLGKVPLPVLAVLFFTACMTFAGWMWNTEATIGEARESIALNAEKITGMKEVARMAENRLDRMDTKLDEISKQIVELTLELRKARYARNYPAFDPQPQPFVSPSPNPLTNRRENR